MTAATRTNTLGFVVWTLILPAVIWLFGAVDKWLQLRKSVGVRAALIQAVRLTVRTGFIGCAAVIALALAVWATFIVKTMYADHLTLVQERTSAYAQILQIRHDDANKIARIERDIDNHRHNFIISDPVFSNIAYMHQAFASFRSMTRTPTGQADCQIKITAPPESWPFALGFGQLSVAASGCPTSGPYDPAMDPDSGKEALRGMIREKIVFHMLRNDIAANSLFNELGKQIELQRSYDLPPSAQAHFVWLQFGSKVHWKSEPPQRPAKP